MSNFLKALAILQLNSHDGISFVSAFLHIKPLEFFSWHSSLNEMDFFITSRIDNVSTVISSEISIYISDFDSNGKLSDLICFEHKRSLFSSGITFIEKLKEFNLLVSAVVFLTNQENGDPCLQIIYWNQ